MPPPGGPANPSGFGPFIHRCARRLRAHRAAPAGAGNFSAVAVMRGGPMRVRQRLTRGHLRRTSEAPGRGITDAQDHQAAFHRRPRGARSVAGDAGACRPDMPARPRSLSHVVYFVPDAAKAEAFYARLGFVCTDRFTGVGPFLRPAGTLEHHTLFMIQTPPFMKGCEHFTFHMGGPTDLLLAGTRLVDTGYQSFWGPGRHKFGSNWFWYFNSPLGCHVEYDADMDLHDSTWAAREVPMSADASQLFLFQHREKWAPSGPPPAGAAH
eukprot:gene41193-50990_t